MPFLSRLSLDGLRLSIITLILLFGFTGSGLGRTPVNFEKSEEVNQLEPTLSISQATYLQEWPKFFATHETGLINASFDCFGFFGSGFSRSLGLTIDESTSFNVVPENHAQYLFAGSMWIGGVVNGDTLVSTSSDGWIGLYEMYPSAYPQPTMTLIPSPGSDTAFRAEFVDTFPNLPNPDYDRPHQPLGLRVANRSYSWHMPNEDRIILYDMVVSNDGNDAIESGYIGFYYDADVALDPAQGQGFADDIAGYLSDSSIAYILDNDGDFQLGSGSTVQRGFCFRLLDASVPLANTSFNWWISNGNASLDFGPRHKGTRPFPSGATGTPVTDTLRYHVLSNKEIDYDQIYTASIDSTDPTWEYPPQSIAADFTDGFDTRFLLSFGPFDLQPGQSERFIYSTFISDTVHVNSTNFDHLMSSEPDSFLAGLDLSSLYSTGAIADSLAQLLLDPDIPPLGLKVVSTDTTSALLEWDSYAFDDVVGYAIGLGAVTPDMLDHAGTPMPWFDPVSLDREVFVDADKFQYEYTGLDPNQLYFAVVAHRTTFGTRQYSKPIYFRTGGRIDAPTPTEEFAFYSVPGSLTLSWSPPDDPLDEYRIYRIDDTLPPAPVYHAFYDSGSALAALTPTDIHLEGADTFYYYEMPVYATVPASDTEFVDYSPVDGSFYIVSAVQADGSESEFSPYIEALIQPERTRGVLVVTHSNRTANSMMNYDSVVAFYNQILSGLDYDIYSWGDTANSTCPDGVGCVDWRTFMKYELVIVDDDWNEQALNESYEATVAGYKKIILGSGKLAYFGSFSGLHDDFVIDADPQFHEATHPFVQRFFPVDSLFHVGLAYFFDLGLPPEDELFGFSRAVSIVDSLPSIAYDTARNPFSNFANSLWPDNSPPSVSVFSGVDPENVTHLAEVLPSIVGSPLDNQPVGVRFTSPEDQPLYLYGFHLWYMNPTEARTLVLDMLQQGCCIARGNVTGDDAGTVNIADLTMLVDFLFRGGLQPSCPEEADVNASGSIDVADLTTLVDFLFRGGAAPPPCP